MRSLLFTFVILLCYCTVFGQFQFRGLKWGSSLEAMKLNLVPSQKELLGYKAYDRSNEDLAFEGIEAHSITYGFKKKELRMVSIGIFGGDFKKVVRNLEQKYGKSTISEKSVFINFEWHLEDTDISATWVIASTDPKNATVNFRSAK